MSAQGRKPPVRHRCVRAFTASAAVVVLVASACSQNDSESSRRYGGLASVNSRWDRPGDRSKSVVRRPCRR